MSDSSPPTRRLTLKQVCAEIGKHRGLYLLAFLLWGLPLGLGTVWSMVMGGKTLPDWLAENGWPRLSALVIGWLAVAVIIAVVTTVRSYKSAQRQSAEALANTAKRDFLVGRLAEFSKEANQSNSIGRFVSLGFIEAGLWQRIEKFLEIHLPNEVERFKRKGIDGVEEIIKDLLDGKPSNREVERAGETKVLPPHTPTTQIGTRSLLEEIEQTYDLKELQPNFVDMGNEYVEAYNDEKGVVVRGSSPEKDAFHVHVRSFGNEHPRNKVKSLQKVSFRLNFVCFDRGARHTSTSITIHRGAWLTEAEIEVDFPAHCPPRRAVIVTAEGADNRVYAVRRDSDSSYKSILPLREELTGKIYGVFVSLLVESRNSKAFQYILEIIREPYFDIRLTDAVLWKSSRLHKLVNEGIAFVDAILEIGKQAQEQAPTPPSAPVTIFSLYPSEAAKFDWASYHECIRSTEREGEEKLIDTIKDWEARAADFIELYISAEESDKFIKSIPALEVGLKREERRSNPFRLLPRNAPPPPPELPYWTLGNAVSMRMDKLMEIVQKL